MPILVLLASGMTNMYILRHFDWYGPIEELEALEKIIKKHWDGSDGIKYLGRFGPHSQKYHWTEFYKAKDFKTWTNRTPPDWDYKRDYKVMTHQVMEYYTDA